MVRYIASVLLLVLVSGRTASGAGATKTVQRLAVPLGCERLTIAEGLPNSSVRATVQDKRGFIWLGTQDGLARYDGTRMRQYRPIEKDETSLSAGYITALVLDPSGKIWVGTAEHGVNLYDPETDRFTRFSRGAAANTLSSEGVTSIARDKKDRIWFAMSGGGLNRYEPESGTFTRLLDKPLDVAILSIDVDAAGHLWLGTAADGAFRWNPDGGAAAVTRATPGDDLGIGNVPIPAVQETSDGRVWLGTDGEGLISFDPKTNKYVRYRHDAGNPATLSDDHISAVYEDRSKNIWVGTTNGVNRIDPSGRIVRFLHDRNDPTSLPFHGVESLFQDDGGVMWIGGFTVGACKFVETNLRLGQQRTHGYATAFAEEPDGSIWVGTYDDGLYRYERAAQRVTSYRDLRERSDGEAGLVTFESGAWISALHRDRRGTIWIAIRGRGLLSFDPKSETYRDYSPEGRSPNALTADTIFRIFEDEAGMLWLATWGAGLLRFDPQREVATPYTASEGAADAGGLTSNHLYSLYPDPVDKQILWLASGKGGLIRFNMSTGTATSFRHRDEDPTSISNDDVTSVFRDPSGMIWAGTYGAGLNRIDPATGKAERFTRTSAGLPNDVILGMIGDNDGKLWLTTNGGGLVHFDPKTKQFAVYEAVDGLQDNEFSQGAVFRSKAGELFFGGPHGWNAFYPKDVKRDPYVPPVVLTAFKLFNQEVSLERPIWTLPPLEVSYSDSFEIQFAALSFAAPHKNRYAYKLEGFDDEFIETDRPFATYTKLGGGNYTLRIRAANHHGVWNEAGIEIKLAVAPPFWRTWRAYGVYLLLLAGLIYLLFRLQRQRVLRAEREGRLAVVERDLELTGAVQSGFLPDHNEIATSRAQMFGLYRPADACGGDWWWHEPLSGGRHVVMVGDVSGHGPGPAMVTAAVATAFRVLIENGLDDVKHALEMLNREVLRVAKGKYHMTMAALELDEATGHWILHSAGAPPILSLGGNGKHKVHFCTGAPLGTEHGFETGRVEGRLDPRDRILIYTDGIPEIELPTGGVFGMRRFAQLYEHTRDQDLKTAAMTIVMHADQSLGGKPQADDWTFALIEWG